MKKETKLSQKIAGHKVKTILFGLAQLLRIKSRNDQVVKNLVSALDFTAQIKLMDNSLGRWFMIKGGRVTSKPGILETADVLMAFSDAEEAWRVLSPWRKLIDVINGMKNFRVIVDGDERLVVHFTKILSWLVNSGIEYGVKMKDDTTRYVNNTNGGPLFVYVKDDKIIRVTPVDLEDEDADPWTIEARGKRFSPPKQVTIAPYAQCIKSTIYSEDRLLYPMKRVDFDPNGKRNIQNRGISGYERISWEEATDIVAEEIKRVKREHGPGAIMNGSGSHHTWGNLGYWLSARPRFFNLIGSSVIEHNPDSWEGFYWGATHHWGNSWANGAPDTYGTVSDLLKNCEMIVFWSSDPEATSGCYGAQEGTIRRLWAKELGIKLVHIDPFFNHTAAFLGGKWLSPRPATGNALALAIAYVWITEDLYDKWFVENRTTGFDEWRDYVLGKEDGVPKTPEWQETETLIPAHDARALAREWGKRKTYLACGGFQGFGSACRCATGIEWARSMVYLMAMQGIGKPGVNMGNLQNGAPVDYRFYFPGYAEGAFSGDLQRTANAMKMYQSMPQLMTMNTVQQVVPRLHLPEAIIDTKTQCYPTDARTIEGQFAYIPYPLPGSSPVRLYYKYGGSHFGTMVETNRYARMYQSENMEFVVNQSIWFEGEAKFADVILPACTNFERWDIGEFANCGGYALHAYNQVNQRVITIQHPCIKPLGESKSDYEIFLMIATKLGLGAMFSETKTELDWCRDIFNATDLPKVISWKKFLKKGYYVVPPIKEGEQEAVAWNWFYEGRKKDVPDPAPAASDYTEEFRSGLQTQSGKLEFVSSSLKRFDPNDPERPVMSKYIPSWEGHHTTELYEKYPLQLITPHNRYSFHTMMDGKNSTINDIKDHRVLIEGHYYWIARINTKDAAVRGIEQNDLVEIFNDRGSVICAAMVTERVPAGTAHSYESSARYEPIGKPGESPDRGGCVNILTPSRTIIKKSHASAVNSCLVDIRKWKKEA